MLRHTRAKAFNRGLPSITWSVALPRARKAVMWFLVQVVKGSRHYEAESPIGNRVLISDTTEMVISGRALGTDGYRFEARKGNDSFVVGNFPGASAPGSLARKFLSLAHQVGAISLVGEAQAVPSAA
jgi:hypothetical protein